MPKWIRYLIITVVSLLFGILFLLLPVENWNVKLQPWDSLLAIVSFVGSVVFGIWAAGERRKQPALNKSVIKAETIIQGDKKFEGGNHSTVAEKIEHSTIIQITQVFFCKFNQLFLKIF